MSRWGHSMFRLVICDPKRKEVSEECLKDISSHVVVSFRANVDDFISLKKGLFGGYDSLIYFLDFNETEDSYTVEELREAYSLPLKYSREEIAQFVNKAVENYWSYRGKYYFLTNNCMSEAVRMILAPLDEKEHKKWLRSKPATPKGLFRQLLSSENADAEVIDSEERVAEGYYFPSRKQSLKDSFDVLSRFVKESGLKIRFPKKVNKYLKKTSMKQRKEWYRQLAKHYSRLKGEARVQRDALQISKNPNYALLTNEEKVDYDLSVISSSALNLEAHIFRVSVSQAGKLFNARLREELKRGTLDEDLVEEHKERKKQALASAVESYAVGQSIYSYGVPLVEEMRKQEDILESQQVGEKEREQKYEDLFKSYLPGRYRHLEALTENYQFFNGGHEMFYARGRRVRKKLDGATEVILLPQP